MNITKASNSHKQTPAAPLFAPQTAKEIAVLGSIFETDSDPQPHAAKLIDNAPESFIDPEVGAIAAAIRVLRKTGENVDLLALNRLLRSRGNKASMPLIAAMSSESLPPGLTEVEAEELWTNYTRRRIAELGNELIGALKTNASPQRILDGAEAALASISEANAEKCNVWQQRRYDPDKMIPEPEAVFKLNGITIGTPGNIGAITAPIKAGKSAVISAMIAATLSPETGRHGERDTFTFTSSNPECKAVIHIDTEQTEGDHQKLMRTVEKRAQVDRLPSFVHSFWLKGLTAPEIRKNLKSITTNAARECGGVHSILIDGAADLVVSVNDEEECNFCVSGLEAMAVEHDCHVIGVIHFNPGTDKTRGHLGSQLERKSESNLKLEKTEEITAIFSGDKQRGAPILRETAPSFRWDDEAKMHLSCDTQEVVKQGKSRRVELTPEDLLAHVPQDGSPIKKTKLLELKKPDGVGKDRWRAQLDELIDSGDLFEWKTARKSTNALRQISRKPQPEEDLLESHVDEKKAENIPSK